MDGRWAKDVSRITILEPVGQSLEVLEGHWAGTSALFVYRQRGDKTQVDVFAEVKSETIPERDLKRICLKVLEGAYDEDAPRVRALADR